MLDDWQLALVQLKIDDLPRFSLPPGQFFLDLLLKLLRRHLAGFVQPDCTIEVLTIPLGQLGQLHTLGPADFLQLLPRLW